MSEARRPRALIRESCRIGGRIALLLALYAVACRSGSSEPQPSSPPSAKPPMTEPDTLALKPQVVSSMAESERGGLAVVVLHGWGAAGGDLVPLARKLARPRSRFFVPAAPLPEGPRGRAWWSLTPGERPAHAWDDRAPADYRPVAQVTRVRTSVQRLLRDIRDRYAPERLALVGFSQGAMLSLDVALAGDPPVERAALLSGVVIADSLPALHAAREPRTRFFVSHGRSDQVLPYRAGEATSQLLEKYGYATTFRAFDGGHAIPPEILAALEAFLYEGQ